MKSTCLIIVSATLLVLGQGMAIADQCHRNPEPDPAEVVNNGRELYFNPLDEFKVMTLEVTGSWGYVYKQEVGPGEKAVFRLGDETYDGCYSWEIRTIPFLSPELLDILAQARQSGDMSQVRRLQAEGVLPDQVRAGSGQFRVVNGEIVADDRPEDRGKAAAAGEQSTTLAADGGQTAQAGLRRIREAQTEPMMTPMPSMAKDYLIYDDLIVDGSACIGFDCANGWSFDFTTIGLSENNTRIKFDDTSTIASYPRNDWQLMANDSANGGASRFSIIDCGDLTQGACSGPIPFSVEAGAGNNALYVDDHGRVGFGTATPSVELHTVDGDTPTLRLAQDGSSGFAPQTWDVAGNETNFFVRDVTSGSTLPFRIKPGSPSSTLTVTGSGVGVGTWSPSAKLHVIGSSTDVVLLQNSGNVKITMENTTTGGHTWALNNATQLRFSGDGASTAQMALDLTGNLTIQGTLTESSDRNVKEGFKPVEPAEVLKRLAGLDISTWSFIADDESVRHLGPMAQDFYAAFGLGADNTHIAPLDTSGVALAAIKGLAQALEEKDQKIESLESRIEALETLLQRLSPEQTE